VGEILLLKLWHSSISFVATHSFDKAKVTETFNKQKVVSQSSKNKQREEYKKLMVSTCRSIFKSTFVWNWIYFTTKRAVERNQPRKRQAQLNVEIYIKIKPQLFPNYLSLIRFYQTTSSRHSRPTQTSAKFKPCEHFVGEYYKKLKVNDPERAGKG